MQPLTVLAAFAVGIATMANVGARAQTVGHPAAGRSFALQVCTPCHLVAADQISPKRFITAPDFPAIANTLAMTELALHVFLSNPHPTMPNLVLTPQEQDDVIAYIVSLRRKP